MSDAWFVIDHITERHARGYAIGVAVGECGVNGFLRLRHMGESTVLTCRYMLGLKLLNMGFGYDRMGAKSPIFRGLLGLLLYVSDGEFQAIPA